MDPADREHYGKQLAKISSKQTVTATSSLLNALDEDYGVKNISATVTEMFNATTTDNSIENILAANEVNNCDRTNQNRDELVEKGQSDDEGVIPCTPPPVEKTLKRKAVIDKKQKKLTDMYPKVNTNQ